MDKRSDDDARVQERSECRERNAIFEEKNQMK
jgi:hypothetical protein